MARLTLNNYRFINPKQTKNEKIRRTFLGNRMIQMDTEYRDQTLEMAQLGRDAVDGIATDEERIMNTELMRISYSYAVIAQRLATMIDNPSKAVYRSPKRNKRKKILMEQLNEHDKRVGNYNSIYQDNQRTAETEGTCVVRQGWKETLIDKDGEVVTIGDIFTEQMRIPLEDFYWDPSASELRGNTGHVANDCFVRERMTIEEFRAKYQGREDYKNIKKVKPFTSDSEFQENMWMPEWETKKIQADDPSNDVIVWHYYSTSFWNLEKNKLEDAYIVYANGVEIRNTKLQNPTIKGEPVLPFYKIVAIPSGQFGGISIPALIRHPERALQRMVTMADAQAELAVNPPQFVSSQIFDTLDDEELYPGKRIESPMSGKAVADEIHTMQVQDMTNGAQYIINKMEEIISIISGVDVRAFFESPKQKAVSTERKREIQERLLRYSVIYNESHGFRDMEVLRLAIMQENYPVKRNFLDKQDDGTELVVERFPEIPVEGFTVSIIDNTENETAEKRKFELKKEPSAFSLLTVNPMSVEYNLDLYVQGALEASNEDTFKFNKEMDKLSVLTTNPWTLAATDPIKGAREVYRILNENEDKWIREDLEISNPDMHGAQKELNALLVSDVIPIQLRLDADYDAREYAEVFRNFIASEEFNTILTATVKKKVNERTAFHVQNSLNPYYKEEQRDKEQQQAEAQQASQDAAGGAQGAKVPGRNPNELEGVVDSKAGTLGKAGKTSTQLGAEQ